MEGSELAVTSQNIDDRQRIRPFYYNRQDRPMRLLGSQYIPSPLLSSRTHHLTLSLASRVSVDPGPTLTSDTDCHHAENMVKHLEV